MGASQMTQWVKNLPAMSETQETRVQSLGREDPLEEVMPTHSSILAWEIPWTRSLAGYRPWDCIRVRHNLVTKEQQYISLELGQM